MVSDYRATIQRLLRGKSRTEVFPNFPKTFQKPDQNFFKTVRKIERFFCAAGEGLSRAHGLGAGRLGRLGDGRQPPGAGVLSRRRRSCGRRRHWQRSGCVAGDPRTAIRRAVGCGSGSPTDCRCCCRVAAAVVRRVVSRSLLRLTAAMPLWGVYAVAVAFLWRWIGIYTLSHKKRSEGVLEALRAIDIYARISGGRCRTCQDAHRRHRTRKSPAGHTSGRGKKKAAHAGRQRGLRVAGDPDQDQHGQQQGVQ